MKKIGKNRHGKKVESANLTKIVERNIKTFIAMQHQIDRRKNFSDRIADKIASLSGSIYFFYVHILWFGLWIAINLGFFSTQGIQPFDPFPFGLLTMVVSLEAIFLSTFILISQNRLSVLSDHRADLDVQIDMLSEYEITKLLRLVDAIADHLGIEEHRDEELKELEKIIAPELVMKEVAKRKAEMGINGK